MSQHAVGISESDKLKEIVQLLVSLWEAAERLPEGSERQDAFRQIGTFERRMVAFIRQLGSEPQSAAAALDQGVIGKGKQPVRFEGFQARPTLVRQR